MLKRLASLALIALLASCGGGGGDAGTSPFGSGSTPKTADLVLTASAAQLSNAGSATVVIVATAVDASRNTLASVPVTLSVDSGAVLSGVSGSTTGTDGAVRASLSTGDNRANRIITVTAVSGSISKTKTVQVTGTKITSTLAPAVVSPGGTGKVQYLVVDQAGTAMANQPVQIVATGLTQAEAIGVTGSNGDFVFSFTAPVATGSYTVVANIAGQTDSRTVIVQPTNTVPPVTVPILSASVSANPSVVAVNLSGSSSNRAEIRALFLGASNKPIANVRARFDLNGDANSIGGTFTTGTDTLLSDVNGVVTTAYVPGTRSSPTDGVSVRVCYGATDSEASACTSSALAKLTVAAEPLGVAIGTNGVIIVKTLTYVKQFVISVSDAAGVAKADVNLVASVDLPNYRKGFYTFVGGKWIKAGGDQAVCLNEDTNRNGVLEAGEDVNGDGQLWPRKPDVIVSLLQSKTGADGTAILQIEYAQDHGSWVDAFITVAASGVSGSEGRATYFVAPVPVSADAITATTSPAFAVSPYGVQPSCATPN